MNWLKSICGSKREEELEKQVRVLEAKLKERQEAINRTNAYWKRKLYEVQGKTTRKKAL